MSPSMHGLTTGSSPSLVSVHGTIITLKAVPTITTPPLLKFADANQEASSTNSKARNLDDPSSLVGASKEEILELIPQNWIRGPLKKEMGLHLLIQKN